MAADHEQWRHFVARRRHQTPKALQLPVSCRGDDGKVTGHYTIPLTIGQDSVIPTTPHSLGDQRCTPDERVAFSNKQS